MGYTKHDYQSNDILYAADLAEMDNQIYKNEQDILKLEENKQPAGNYASSEEVSQLRSDLNELSNMKSGAIIQTASGETIVANDSSDSPLRGLRLFGKTEQFTTTGAQLFDTTGINVIQSMGMTTTINNDGSLTVNGTPTSQYSAAAYKTFTLDAGTYYVSGGKNKSGCVYAQLNVLKLDGTYDYVRNKSFTLESKQNVTLYIQSGAHTDNISNYTIYPMVNKGSTPLPYEPYTGGIASPNPNYKQDLVSVGADGSIESGVYGGNLFDITKHKENITATIIYNDDGSVTYRSDNAGDIGGYSQDMTSLLPAGTYTINIMGEALFYMTASGDYSTSWKGIHTFEYDGVSYLRFHGANIPANESRTYKVMLNTGTTALPYKPYKESQTLTSQTPNGLPGIKVTDASLATYTDENGQMWRADEKDYERGVHVQRIYNGSLLEKIDKCQMADNAAYSDSILRFDFTDAFGSKAVTPILSDRFVYTFAHSDNNVAELRNKECISSHSTLDKVSVFIDKGRLTSVSVNGLKAWLQENETNIQVVLATPIETPLSEEELDQYRALHTNDPVTTVLNDSGANMEVKYNADTKLYIDNKFAELQTALVALGGI